MFWLLLALVTMVALAYYRATLQTATAALAGLLLLYGVFGGSLGGFGLCLLLYLALFVPLNLPALREEWFTRPALDFFQRRLLPALGADAAVAENNPEQRYFDLHQLEPIAAAAALTPAEQSFLDGPVETLAVLCGEGAPLREEVWMFLREHGFFGMAVPQPLGGLGFSTRACAAVVRKLATARNGAAAAAVVGSALEAGWLLLLNGSDAQRQELLPSLAAGRILLCLASHSRWTTEAAGAPDRAVAGSGLWKGKETPGLHCSFDKTAAVLAPVATLALVSLRLSDPSRPAAANGQDASVLVVVPLDAPGLTVAADPGADVPRGSLRAHDAFVPLEHLVGPAGAPTDADRALEQLVTVRALLQLSLTAADRSRASAELALRSRLQRHYGLPPPALQLTHRELAHTAMQAYALRAAAQQLTGLLAQHTLAPLLSALLGPAALHDAAPDAAPAADPALTATLDARALALHSRPRWSAVLAAAAEPNPALALSRFDAPFWSLAGDLLSAAARAWMLGLSHGWLASVPPAHPARHALRQLARQGAALALLRDAWLLLRHRDPLGAPAVELQLCAAHAQWMQQRAALAAFESDGRPRADAPLLDALCAEGAWRVDEALDRLLHELHPRGWAALLRALVLPLGRHTRPATDAELRGVSESLQKGGELRERLLAGSYRATDPSSPASLPARAEAALIAAEPVQRRLQRSVRDGLLRPAAAVLDQIAEATGKGLVSPEEADLLRTAYNLAEDLLRPPASESEAARLRRQACRPAPT